MAQHEENYDRNPLTGDYRITFYLLMNTTPGPELRWTYIGKTKIAADRKKQFYSGSKQYSGPKINEAREKYGASAFTHQFLETIEGPNREELEKISQVREGELILQYDSLNHGYNISTSGPGKAKISVKAVAKSGEEFVFESMTAAASTLKINIGTIHYFLKQPGRYCKKGFKFQLT